MKKRDINVINENVITTIDGQKWEIRKITEKYVLIRCEGFHSSSKIPIEFFNENVHQQNKIKI
jgi:hypothetical protein